MSVIEQVRREREDLARVLKNHKGIRKLVEDLYPDRAHFIYELLQNAEDAGATEVQFTLSKSELSFEHNGRPFDARDIYGITDIGEGTKAEDEDKIGRFGVGFKAVFAYSETPHIWSPDFSFKITELVLPSELNSKPEFGKKTRFEFPFNNLKKTSEDAYAEVRKGLEELAETTLLFLSHLESIRWQIDQQAVGEVLRIQHAEHHVEILKQVDGKRTTSSHFLKYDRPVKGKEKHRVAVAYVMEFLPNVKMFDANAQIAKQLKIVPALKGRVAVYFPAEKEESGLRFHLHAPFATELSRASILETTANDPLFNQLAELAAESLHSIRDLNLLTGDFLGVLPNPEEKLERYAPIRTAIIEEMNNRPLTPTHSKSHAPAKYLLQAKASLKDLLSADDLEFLIEYDDSPPQWAISAAQRNSNAFLSGLAIKKWDIAEFITRLWDKAYYGNPDKDFLKWIAAKSIEWHQRMYSLFYKELSPDDSFCRLKYLQIIRLSSGSYDAGERGKCYFPTDDIEHDDVLPRVAKGVYSSGKSETQQEEAKKCLEKIGVREVGEAEQVEAILKQRYIREGFKPDPKDLRRFVALVEKEPDRAALFAEYFIFKCKDGWRMPRYIYLDSPYRDTGLRAYYEALGEAADKWALADSDEACGVSVASIAIFAEAVGVCCHLNIEEQNIRKHPLQEDLRQDYGYGVKRTNNAISEDWTIEHLEKAIAKPSEALSRLVWKTMASSKERVLKARFRPNSRYIPREAKSSLVLLLEKVAWIPQGGGEFVVPKKASRTKLPKGFPYDEGYEWLKAIGFGEEEQQRSEEYREKQAFAKALDFADDAALEDGQWFGKLSPEQRQSVKTEYENRQRAELPERESPNSERRSKLVAEQAANAPERRTEERTRSVSVGLEEVKEKAEHYLRDQYTSSSGEMICQVCKSVLPFQLDDGMYYFEKTEFLTGLKDRHYQNYLALCPDHAAMFQYANRSKDLMLAHISRMSFTSRRR